MSDDAPTVDSLRERLEAIEKALDDADTEADLDVVEENIEALEADLEATLEDDDEDADEDEAEELEADLETLTEELEEARGPYASDVGEKMRAVNEEIGETRWTELGESQLVDALEEFLETVNDQLESDVTVVEQADVDDTDADTETQARLQATLKNAARTIKAADLDPDDDTETISTLLEAAQTLEDAVEDAQTWDDLTVREQLQAQGFYDVLEHVKDFPPEWHALKVHEKRGNVDMVLLSLETFDSDFMEEHALEALERMGSADALEAMHARAQKRDKPAIKILGKIGVADEAVVETLLGYVDTVKDPLLQQVTVKALGEMGATDAVQPIANQLVVENASVRSAAARALGLIGDTRAIEPLADVLAEDDDDTVRASAGWALNQIGTEAALEAVAEYTDDQAYLVQVEAERATLEPAA